MNQASIGGDGLGGLSHTGTPWDHRVLDKWETKLTTEYMAREKKSIIPSLLENLEQDLLKLYKPVILGNSNYQGTIPPPSQT
jgi:hypothetical protein